MDLPPSRKAKADQFRQLHDRKRVLVLPNAWDVASARIFEEAGFPAIGTTSAGIAYTLGYSDRERISRAEMSAAVRRIAEAVRVPVTADIEAGYGGRTSDVVETIESVLEAGAIGVNLEDATHNRHKALFDVNVQVDRIHAARSTAKKAGLPLVINARTDVFLLSVGSEVERLDHVIQRAGAYHQAGADCLFVPGVTDRSLIKVLVDSLPCPLNILAGVGTPPVAVLRKLGVARLSVGSGPMRAAMGLTRRIAQELRSSGTYDVLTENAIPYAEMNQILSRDTE
jgi:2-methylisocitrate lyase-like PEP mutase family enzyme